MGSKGIKVLNGVETFVARLVAIVLVLRTVVDLQGTVVDQVDDETEPEVIPVGHGFHPSPCTVNLDEVHKVPISMVGDSSLISVMPLVDYFIFT